MIGGSKVESVLHPMTEEFQDFWKKFSSVAATEVGTVNVKPRLARIRATFLVPLEGKGNPKGNLEAQSTTNGTYLLSSREAVLINHISPTRVL